MFLKRLKLVTVIPIVMMITAMILRPIWRDEVWALYFSDPNMEIGTLLMQRINHDTHPPFYFIIQHFWRSIFDSILWSKAFNLVCLLLGGGIAWKMGNKHRRETQLFLLLCLGSYWVIYFMAEIRPYMLLFTLCVLSTIFIRNVTSVKHAPPIGTYLIWLCLTVALSLTHYYAALWMGLCGGSLALHGLYMKRNSQFWGFGLLTAIGLIPISLWIYYSLGTINFGFEDRTKVEFLTFGLNQFRRAIIDKTLGSNLAIAAIAILTLPTLLRQREHSDIIMLGTAVSLVMIVFTIHVFVQPFIKERSFIVIIPSLIYLMTRAILIKLDSNTANPRLFKAAIVMAIITPFLFAGEFFKDREKIDDVRAIFTQYPTCQNAPIATYYRPSPQGDDYAAYYTKISLKNVYKRGNPPILLSVQTLTPATLDTILKSNCPIKVLALNLPRGEKQEHIVFRQVLNDADIPYENLALTSIAKNRNILYLDSSSQN